jgi:septal ring factor EnvC (AmiA/AmiB activator)
MTISIVWALWDEAFGQRPWKSMQREFVSRYTRYLDSIKAKSGQTEKEIRESPEFIQLDDAVTAANQEIDPRRKEIDATVERVQKKLDAITEPFQNQRGRLTVISYNIETHEGSAKEKYRRQAENKRAEPITVEMPSDDGKVQDQRYNYAELEKLYDELREEKARNLAEKAELLKRPAELAKKRDDYLRNHPWSSDQCRRLRDRRSLRSLSRRHSRTCRHDGRRSRSRWTRQNA